MDFRDTGLGLMDWFHLAQDNYLGRVLAKTIMNLWFP